MATSSTNIIWDKILKPIRTFMTTEFSSGMKVYISEEYKEVGNLSFRIFCNNSRLESEGNGIR